MKIFILLSTIDRRILRVPEVLSEPMDDVYYVVVWQHSHHGEIEDIDTGELEQRKDVTIVTLPGKGLSRSRNHAMKTAMEMLEDPLEDAVFVIADDDERFNSEAFPRIFAFYREHPDVDLALMRMRSTQNRRYFKKYPDKLMNYRHKPRNYYPASWEMTLRPRVYQAGIRFDTRFGLGAEKLSCGEEDIFLADMMAKGLKVVIAPVDIGYTRPCTTGTLTNETKVLRSRGAVYGYTRSVPGAFLRSLREAASLALRMQTRFIPLFKKIWYGVKYVRNTHKTI